MASALSASAIRDALVRYIQSKFSHIKILSQSVSHTNKWYLLRIEHVTEEVDLSFFEDIIAISNNRIADITVEYPDLPHNEGLTLDVMVFYDEIQPSGPEDFPEFQFKRHRDLAPPAKQLYESFPDPVDRQSYADISAQVYNIETFIPTIKSAVEYDPDKKMYTFEYKGLRTQRLSFVEHLYQLYPGRIANIRMHAKEWDQRMFFIDFMSREGQPARSYQIRRWPDIVRGQKRKSSPDPNPDPDDTPLPGKSKHHKPAELLTSNP